MVFCMDAWSVLGKWIRIYGGVGREERLDGMFCLEMFGEMFRIILEIKYCIF